MTKIQKIADKNGVLKYPLTHFRAVRDDNGNTLEAVMGKLQEDTSEAIEEIQQETEQGLDNAVQYISQTKTDAEKAIARQNIGAAKATVVNNMLASGYMYAGIAVPTTNPSTPASKCFYIAKEEGTYTNFGALELTSGINILKWNGTTWATEQVIGIDDVPTAGSEKLVKSGGVHEVTLGALIKNREMDEVLGGELAVYLTDADNKAVLDDNGKPIEII